MTLQTLIEFFLHIDKYLGIFMQHYGTVTYILMFLAVVGEAGRVVTPGLPGDSLICAAGALAPRGIVSP